MQEIPQILGFTSGELTPWLSTRYDLQAYQRGAARISNFIVQPYGGVKRRPGTALVAEAGSANEDAVRLFPFTYSETDALMLEFFPYCMRVYRNGKLLTISLTRQSETPAASGAARAAAEGASGEGMVPVEPIIPPSADPPIAGGREIPYELRVPWTTAEQIRTLRFTQVNDAVYVTCPTYRPVVIYRLSDTNWKCEEPEFDTCPRATYDRQEEEILMERGGNEQVVTLSLPADAVHTFSPEMAGREYVLIDADVAGETLFRNTGFSPAGASALGLLRTASCKKGNVYYNKNSVTGFYSFWTCIRDYTPDCYVGSEAPTSYPAYFMAGAVWQEGLTPVFDVCGDWELRTNGTWNAQVELWRSYESPEPAEVLSTEQPVKDPTPYLKGLRTWDWRCVKSFGQSSFSERQNWALSGSESRPCRMCLVVREADAATFTKFLFFRKFHSSREYKFLITEVLDAHTAKARPMNVYWDYPYQLRSRKWSFGAFGEYNGYPAFSSYSGGRLWFGGMRRSPTTLIGSVVDDFHNFRVSSEDDSALHLTIASDNQSRICWIAPARGLLVGTSDGVWMLGGGDGGPLTPSNAAFRRQTSVGCENMPALAVEGSVIFPQRCGTRLREISYKLESDGFAASDLSLLAEHLLRSGVREYAVQEGTGSYVWVVLNDGSLAVLTLHPEQQVSAWQQVEIPGCEVLHVATLPRAGAELDEVWLAVRRLWDGRITLQRLCAENPYCDASQTLTSNENGVAELAAYHANAEVCLLREGEAPRTVSVGDYGRLAGLEPNTVYSVGNPFTSELHTLPLESMNSFNSVREMSRLRLRLLESSLEAEYKATHAERWEKLEAERLHLSTPYTGSVRLSHMPEAAVGQGLCLRCTGTSDFRLLGLTVEVDHHGK